MTTTETTPPLTISPVARAEMLIRKPVAEVFEAFIDPAITANFWFTKGSGRLEPGTQVQWDWEMYGASAQVRVLEVEPLQRIRIGWSGYGDTTVEWRFTPRADGTTFVSITEAGFTGDAAAVCQQAMSSTEGFTLVLAGLKAWLEHHLRLNLVGDRFPANLAES